MQTAIAGAMEHTKPFRNVTNTANNAFYERKSRPNTPAAEEIQEIVKSVPISTAASAESSYSGGAWGSLPAYGEEVLHYYMMRERTLVRDAHYLHNQPEVTERMRCILLDWLVDVHIKFKLHPETYFLAVDIIDRYLSLVQVARGRLQLIGVVATLLAAKLEEIWPPEVRECVYIAANTYSREEILECEREVSNRLSFRLTVPTCFPIMSAVLDAVSTHVKAKSAAAMFLEIAAIDYGSLLYLPSTTAFAAILLANLLLRDDDAPLSPEVAWPPSLAALTRTDYVTIHPCAERILSSALQMLIPSSRYQATLRKYSNTRHHEVATLSLPAALPQPNPGRW